jgi:hypothetical protein
MAVGGVDWPTVLAAMHAWVVAGSGLSNQKVVWGQQDAPRPDAPAIAMRISRINESGPTWTDTDDNYVTFADLTISAVDAGTDTLTSVAHGRLTGDGPVRVTSTGDVPDGLDASTDYWVVKTSADAFKLAAAFFDAMAGTPVVVDIVDAGTGVIKLVDTATTTRAGEELQIIARVPLDLTLELRCHADPVISGEMAVAILQRIRTRREWPSQQTILSDVNIALGDVGQVLAVAGTRDDFLFEPRAHLWVHMLITAEEGEALAMIQRVLMTDRIPEPDVEFTVELEE